MNGHGCHSVFFVVVASSWHDSLARGMDPLLRFRLLYRNKGPTWIIFLALTTTVLSDFLFDPNMKDREALLKKYDIKVTIIME